MSVKMQELSKEQNEIIEFTRNEFQTSAPDEVDRRKMYETIRVMAKLKWPNKDFGISLLEKDSEGIYLRECP